MTTVTSDAYSVFGEDAPRVVAPVLLLVGSACWFFVLLPADPMFSPSDDVAAAVSSHSAAPAADPSEPPVADTPTVVVSPPEEAEDELPATDEELVHLEEIPEEPVLIEEPCAHPVTFVFDPGARDPVAVAPGRMSTFLEEAASHPDARVVIEGYASQDGVPSLNLKLSHDRAAAAGRVLEQRGIAHDRIVLQAFGEYRPSLKDDHDRRAVARLDGIDACSGDAQ